MSTALPPRTYRGFSLLELTIVLALVAILAASALPSLHGMLMQRALNGRANELATDLQYLRNEALARNEGLSISIQSGAAGSCYVLHSGSTRNCDCLSPEGARCSGEARSFKSVFLPAAAAVQFGKAGSMRFDPVHGTSTPAGSVDVQDTQGHVIRHVVNSLGRVHSCAPKAPVVGYKPCQG